MAELLIGCGNSKKKRLTFEGIPQEFSGELVTLDFDDSCNPDVLHDLNQLPYPFPDNHFDEIHAYEVLEHCGRQGDWRFFFNQFYEFWRILKPDGYFVATVPAWDQGWAWGDPGHTRIIAAESLIFLSKKQYSQIGKTSMTDYRKWWNGDFDVIGQQESEASFGFVLKAIK